MDAETKRAQFELKADAEGEFVATFATLNVIDSDQDVTLPGAFAEGSEVLIGSYNHDEKAWPVGVGAIEVEGDQVRVAGEFMLDTAAGADAHRVVKRTAAIMEWSYIYQPTEVGFGRFKTPDGSEVPVRFLKGIDVWSIDPVMKGAGVGTGTDSVKSALALSYADHGAALLADAEVFAKRTDERISIRTNEGRQLSADDRDRGTELLAALGDLVPRLGEAFKADPADAPPDLALEMLRYQQTIAETSGLLVRA